MVQIESFRSCQIFFDTLLNLFANIIEAISLNIDLIMISYFCLILFCYLQIGLDLRNCNAQMRCEYLLQLRVK